MKLNIFLTFISIAIASLIGYPVFNVAEGQENDILCGIGSGICFVVMLIPMLGLKYQSSRLGTNIRILSTLFFIAFLISNFCFARYGINMPYYIITDGLLLVIYVAIFYKMQGIKDI